MVIIDFMRRRPCRERPQGRQDSGVTSLIRLARPRAVKSRHKLFSHANALWSEFSPISPPSRSFSERRKSSTDFSAADWMIRASTANDPGEDESEILVATTIFGVGARVERSSESARCRCLKLAN